MHINVKKVESDIVIFLYYYTLLIQGFMSLLGLPQVMLYIKDLLLCICVGCVVLIRDKEKQKKKNAFKEINFFKKNRFLYVIPVFLLSASVISSLINGIELTKMLIAIRKAFRGYLYFYFCANFLNTAQIDDMLKKTNCIQIVNSFWICFDRFILGFNQDHSNGIFGTGYTNNYNSVLCLILICYSTVEYSYGKITLNRWIFRIVINFIIIIVAELKVLFFLVPISIFIILRRKIFTQKGIKILVLFSTGMVMAIALFGVMYADQLEVLTSVSGLKNYNNWGLATHAMVDRKNWLPYTVENVFETNILKNLLGIGFGEVSGSLSSSEVFSEYQLMGYGSYTASTMFLEVGFLGLISLFGWFVYLLVNAFGTNVFFPKHKFLNDFETAFVLCMGVFLVYANFVNNDSCFLAFFALSFPYVYKQSFNKLREGF